MATDVEMIKEELKRDDVIMKTIIALGALKMSKDLDKMGANLVVILRINLFSIKGIINTAPPEYKNALIDHVMNELMTMQEVNTK